MRFGLTGEGVEPVKDYGSRVGVKYSFEPWLAVSLLILFFGCAEGGSSVRCDDGASLNLPIVEKMVSLARAL
jgi:hypothetical protein